MRKCTLAKLIMTEHKKKKRGYIICNLLKISLVFWIISSPYVAIKLATSSSCSKSNSTWYENIAAWTSSWQSTFFNKLPLSWFDKKIVFVLLSQTPIAWQDFRNDNIYKIQNANQCQNARKRASNQLYHLNQALELLQMCLLVGINQRWAISVTKHSALFFYTFTIFRGIDHDVQLMSHVEFFSLFLDVIL